MKILKLSITVLILFVLAACRSNEKVENTGSTPEEIIENAPYLSSENIHFIASEISSDKKLDSLILSYEFGMSEQEVEEYSEKLVNENKLQKGTGEYIYNFRIGNNTIPAGLSFKYEEDELMTLTFVLQNEKNNKEYLNDLLKIYVNEYMLEKEKSKKAILFKMNQKDEAGYSYKIYNLFRGPECIQLYAKPDGIFVVFLDQSRIPKIPEGKIAVDDPN